MFHALFWEPKVPGMNKTYRAPPLYSPCLYKHSFYFIHSLISFITKAKLITEKSENYTSKKEHKEYQFVSDQMIFIQIVRSGRRYRKH